MTGSALLRINGILLVIMGVQAAVMDVLSYALGSGIWGNFFYKNPIVIGPFEAHFLAFLFGLILFRFSSTENLRFLHLIAALLAMGLGASNLVWFEIFHMTNSVRMGIVATAIHGFFCISNGFYFLRAQARKL